jgi:hypothetical protein
VKREERYEREEQKKNNYYTADHARSPFSRPLRRGTARGVPSALGGAEALGPAI